MKTVNLKKPITAKWIVREGWRLDAAPFLSGKVEALLALEKLPTTRLADLTHGHDGGIYNGPQFRRVYVDDPEQGVPFIGSSDMLLADLTRLPLLRRKDAESSRLSYLKLQEGMTLISCSGTIGRTVFCRPDMSGAWSSQDVLKVVPDPAKVPPGYVYAYLKSRFGAPLVISGTYGAIIQHLEPQHLHDLPVPRLSAADERSIHSNIGRAGKLRAESAEFFSLAAQTVARLIKIEAPRNIHEFVTPLISTASAKDLIQRFDAHYFNKRALDSRFAWDGHPNMALSDVAEVYIPNIFKRRYAPDKSFGYPYLTGGDIFTLMPEIKDYLLRPVAEEGRLLLTKGMIVIQDSGQVGGLIGSSVIIGAQLDGYAATNNMVRILAKDAADSGYLFAILRSEHGRRLLEREATGTSIPHLDQTRVATIRIPWPDHAKRRVISEMIEQAVQLRDKAAALDHKAIAEVESAIGESRG